MLEFTSKYAAYKSHFHINSVHITIKQKLAKYADQPIKLSRKDWKLLHLKHGELKINQKIKIYNRVVSFYVK